MPAVMQVKETLQRYAFTREEWNLAKDKLTIIAGGRIDKRNDFAAQVSPKDWHHTGLLNGSSLAFFRLRIQSASSVTSLPPVSIILRIELFSCGTRGNTTSTTNAAAGTMQPGADINPYLGNNDLKAGLIFLVLLIGAQYTGENWVLIGY